MHKYEKVKYIYIETERIGKRSSKIMTFHQFYFYILKKLEHCLF